MNSDIQWLYLYQNVIVLFVKYLYIYYTKFWIDQSKHSLISLKSLNPSCRTLIPLTLFLKSSSVSNLIIVILMIRLTNSSLVVNCMLTSNTLEVLLHKTKWNFETGFSIDFWNGFCFLLLVAKLINFSTSSLE